jgi:hypothetical protein
MALPRNSLLKSPYSFFTFSKAGSIGGLILSNSVGRPNELKIIKSGFLPSLKSLTGFIRNASLRLMASQSTVSSTLNV